MGRSATPSAMEARTELLEFYAAFRDSLPADNPLLEQLYGPELLWADDDYFAARERVAVIGKQIDGCDYHCRDFVSTWSVQQATALTKAFDFGATYYASPFWQFFHVVRRSHLGTDSSRRSLLWANLVKFVTGHKDPVLWQPYREEALSLQDAVFKAELRILRPDICIFVVGPEYDEILSRYFPGLQFVGEPSTLRHFARLEHQDLPARSYRTFHPLGMRYQGRWDETLALLGGELGWP